MIFLNDYILCSERLRKEVESGSPLGQRVSSFLSTGSLVPDDLANDIIKKAINEAKPEGWLLDGYPRTVDQARHLDSYLRIIRKSFDNSPFLTVVNVELDNDVAMAKLLGREICTNCGSGFNTADIVRGSFDMPAILPDPSKCILGESRCSPQLERRADDTAETIRKRIEIHREATAPILDYYKNQSSTNRNNSTTDAAAGGVGVATAVSASPSEFQELPIAVLHTFCVYKGIKEADDLLQLICNSHCL